MNTILEFDCDLIQLDRFAKELANENNIGNIYLLQGDLGAGKTTFARSFINALHDKHNVLRPNNIKSPSFPILINYSLKNYEINHYDLYRLKNYDELLEIGLFENLERNISIVEWPNLIINNYSLKSYYLLEFTILNINKRNIKLKHSDKI